jgi:serine/threonine-protein kinase
MGSLDSDSTATSDEKPQHTINLNAYWIDQTEVTNAMYAKCVQAGICQLPLSTKSRTHDSYYGDAQFTNFPVMSLLRNLKTHLSLVMKSKQPIMPLVY